MIEIIEIMFKSKNQAMTIFLLFTSIPILILFGTFFLSILEGLQEIILALIRRKQEIRVLVVKDESLIKEYLKNTDIPLIKEDIKNLLIYKK
ncbi:MAG: hypothetical protein WC678_03720 [Parcubacteria group bacterium]|jgi:hypothetical protein